MGKINWLRGEENHSKKNNMKIKSFSVLFYIQVWIYRVRERGKGSLLLWE